jgi:hypothetical protein
MRPIIATIIPLASAPKNGETDNTIAVADQCLREPLRL